MDCIYKWLLVGECHSQGLDICDGDVAGWSLLTLPPLAYVLTSMPSSYKDSVRLNRIPHNDLFSLITYLDPIS